MNKEEILNKYIDLIDKGYCCDCNELNCIDNFPHAKITHAIRELQQQCKKQKEVIDRKKYLLIEQGAELKELYSEIDKLQGRIDKAIEYLEEPNRDSFDYSKAKLLDILEEVSE